jgi:hypothetical protein
MFSKLSPSITIPEISSVIKSKDYTLAQRRRQSTFNQSEAINDQKTNPIENSRNAPFLSNLKTGSFKTWLTVEGLETYFKRGWKNLIPVKIDMKIKNQRNAQRKFRAQQMDALMKGLSKPMTEILNLYSRAFRDLHPYEVKRRGMLI